jgi:hypothetical protein
MAVVKVLKASKLLSASGGFYERVEAYNLTSASWSTTTLWTVLTGPITVSVTFSTAGNQLGFLMNVRNCTAGTLTIVLKEGASTRTTDTYNFATNPLNTISGVCSGWHYFPLTSYAVTTAPATWSYVITCSSATPQALVTTASGTNVLYMVTLNADSTVVASGDTMVISDGVALTVDQAVTHGIVTGSTICVISCMGSTYQVVNADLSAPMTITMNGSFWGSYNSLVYFGSSTLPISVANRVTLDCSGNGLAYLFVGQISGSYLSTSATTAYEFYGAEDSYIAARVATTATAGQANVVLTTDVSAQWANGNALCIIGKVHAAATDTVNNTVGSIAGTTLTLGTVLDYDVLAGAAIVNQNRNTLCGIQITGLETQSVLFAGSRADYYHFAGVYLYKIGISGAATANSMFRNTKNGLLRNVLFDDQNTTPLNVYYMAGCTNLVVSGLYHFSTRSTYLSSMFFCITGNNMTIANVFCKNFSTAYVGTPLSSSTLPITISGNGNTVTGIVYGGGRSSTTNYASMLLWGASDIFTDIFVYCVSAYPFTIVLVNSTINNLVINGAQAYSLYSYQSINVIFNTPNIGSTTKGTTGEIYSVSDTLNTLILNTPTFNAAPVSLSDNIANTLPGSYTRIQNYGGTSNDCRGYEYYGNYLSSGTGATLTTVHTAGGYAICLQPTNSTMPYDWTFTVPTGNIQNKTMMVGCWVKINSANYYSVTYQMPRLNINYDNGTIAYCQAATGTDWQYLAVPFTPLTTYGQITVSVTGATDQLTTSAYVYVDDFSILYPAGYQLNLGTLDLWANALPVSPPISTNLSALDVWTAASAISYGSGTMGEVLKALQVRTGTAQGGAALSITLDASASNVNDYYNENYIVITGGTGQGQCRRIFDYDGGSKIVTINRAWSTNPVASSTFSIIPFFSVENAVWDALTTDHAVSGSESALLGAVNAKTTNLPASPAATGAAMSLTTTALDAILDRPVEGTYTIRHALEILLAEMAGKASGGGTATIVYKNPDDTKSRVTLTVDTLGNRSAVVTDLT